MVLLSLARASEWSTRKVAYEDLVLQAWRDFPQEFSLRNHPEHPDASDIHKRLYQTLKPAGLALSLGNKVFRLTDEGVERAKGLAAQISGAAHSTPAASKLARDEESFIDRALKSRAFSTWQAGEAAKLIDYDARMFFQFSTGTPLPDRRLRVDFVMKAIDKAERVGLNNAAELKGLAAYLVDHFAHLITGEQV